jgi:hypothetical protein
MVRRVLGFIVIRGAGRGAAEFEASMVARLDHLAMTGTGAALFSALRATRRPVHLCPFSPGEQGGRHAALYALIDREGHSSVRYTADAAPEIYGEAGLGGRTLFQPEFRRVQMLGGADRPATGHEDAATIVEARWSDGPDMLFRALVHQLRYYLGLDERASRGAGESGTGADTRAELAATLFENCYRAEVALPLRQSGAASFGDPTTYEAWNDPILRPRLEDIVAEMAGLADEMRQVAMHPHPLSPPGFRDERLPTRTL